MKNILVEIGCEEIPARMLASAVLELEQNIENWIIAEEIDPDYEKSDSEIAVHATPRRIVINGQLPDQQQDRTEVIKGPPEHVAYDDGEPGPALQGFCRQNEVSPSEVEIKEVDGGRYVFASRTIAGKSLEDCISESLPDFVKSISWPKKMRWEASRFTFVRPLRWFLVYVDDKPLELEIGPLTSGTRSCGLRFGDNRVFDVDNQADYFSKIAEDGIILPIFERKELIEKQAHLEAEELSGSVLFPGEVLMEVTNLVEAPTVFSASYEEKFLQLPDPVLVETMVSHQKYFPVADKESGELMPFFIAVRNGGTKGLDSVRRGNQRVLRARLNDAVFFYNKDLKRDFEEYREDLRGVVFQQKLGSLYDKTERLAQLALELPAPSGLETIARHCKNDQVTEMVGELPSLQGTMGRIYAKEAGWPADEAGAIAEHYRPASREDSLPESDAGRWLSLIDRLDTLVGFFALGERPSGAADPYALRRDALGLLRVVLSSKLELDLEAALKTTIDVYRQQDISVAPSDISELEEFLRDRLYFWFREESNYPPEILEAVLPVFWSRPNQARSRIEWLLDWRGQQAFENLAVAAQRVSNITRDLQRSTPSEELFEMNEEKTLWQHFKQQDAELNKAIQAKKPDDVLGILASFKEPVDRYFEEVMVHCADEKLSENRLAMLRELRTVFDRVADFSKL